MMRIERKIGKQFLMEHEKLITSPSKEELIKMHERCLNKRNGRFRYWRKNTKSTIWYPFVTNRRFFDHLLRYGFVRDTFEFKLYPYTHYWLRKISWYLHERYTIIKDVMLRKKVYKLILRLIALAVVLFD